MNHKAAFSVLYVLFAVILVFSPVFVPPAYTAPSSSNFAGKRAGVWLAMAQTIGGGAGGDYFPTAQEFVNAYFNTGNVFSTAMFYVQVSNPSEITRTLQIASLVDSNPNIKFQVGMGFDIGSSTDWNTVQSFMTQLASHPSVGWVGMEGEHTTYTGCEWGNGCPSIGQAWSTGTLSETALEGYYSQFNTMAANAGLGVLHYYVTFGSASWQGTQSAVVVPQWPVCAGTPYDSPCNPLTNQINELDMGTTSNFHGISGGLSSNDFDAWNPSVNTGSYDHAWDNVISTYIQYAAKYPDSTRSLVIFETGAYQLIDDWYRTIFVNDLASAMAQYPSNWILPGSTPPPQTTTTTTLPHTTTSLTTSTSSARTSSTTASSSSTTTSLATTSLPGTSFYAISFGSFPNGAEPPNWYHDPSFSVQNGAYASTGSTGYQIAYYQGQTFGDATYSVQATGLSANPITGQLPPVLALTFRMADKLDGYWFWGDIDKIQIVKWVAGQPNVLVTQSIGQINPTATYTLTCTARGSSLSCNWNNQYTITGTDSQFLSGYAGVGTYHMNSAFNNLQVSSGGSSSTTTSTTTSTTVTSSTTTSSSPTTSISTTSSTQTTSQSRTTTRASTPSYLLSITGGCPSTGAGSYGPGSLATVTFIGVCQRNGFSGLRVTAWSLDGAKNVTVANNGTLSAYVVMNGPHTIRLYSVIQYQLVLDYGAESSLLSITPSTIPGDGHWFDSGTDVTFQGEVTIGTLTAVGWELDGAPPVPIAGSGSFVSSIKMTSPHTLVVLLSPTNSCTPNACAGTGTFELSLKTNTYEPAGVWVDGAYYPKQVTFVWQAGSAHNITAAPGVETPATRTSFKQWSGLSTANSPSLILTVNESGSLVAEYAGEYLVVLSFTDANGNPIVPQSVVLTGPSSSQTLGSNLSAWVETSTAYKITSATWMSLNSVQANDSSFTVSGPANLNFRLDVYSETIKATDAYDLPLQGVVVDVTAISGQRLTFVTDSNGLAQFRIPFGLFSATASYMGVNDQITTNSGGSHSFTVSFLLSYPLFATVIAASFVIGAFAYLKYRHREPSRSIEYFQDSA